MVASFISPYREARLDVRRMCRRFIEVYVKTSLEECERRDTKGLYRRARAGEIKNFTGLDDPYEAPQQPEIVIMTDGATLQDSFLDLRDKIELMDHLDRLENSSIFILREAYAKLKNVCMLWSIGKDSTVMLWLSRKAFLGHVPFPLVHIDTRYKIPK